MARPYNAANDPIRLGLASLGEGILAGQKRRLAESQAATEAEDKKFQRALQERQAKLLESEEARKADKDKPIDLSRFGALLPEEYIKPAREKYIDDATTSVITDVDKPLPKYEMPQVEFEAIDKIRKANIEELKAKKAAQEKPTIQVRRGDYNSQFGIPRDSGGSPDDILEVPAPALTRPPVVKPGEVKTLSPGVGKIADKIARGEAGLADAEPLVKTQGDWNAVTQAQNTYRSKLGIDAANERTVSGQAAAAARALQDRLFRRDERKDSQAFQAGQKDIDRSIRKGEFAENKDIDRQRLAINQDDYARKVLQDTMSPAMQKHWDEVTSGKRKLLDGLPKIVTDRDKEALATLKDIAPGLGKIDQRIIRPEFQAELNAVRAGEKRAVDIVPPDGYLTVAEGIEKANFLRHEATQAQNAIAAGVRTDAKNTAEKNRQTSAATATLRALEPRFKDKTKSIYETMAQLKKSIAAIRSGDAGRAKEAQFAIAKSLDDGGKLSDNDYKNANLMGGYKRKFDAWTKELLQNKVPAWRQEDLLKYAADAEKIAQERFAREKANIVSSVRSGLKAAKVPSSELTDDDIITYYTGGETFESPAVGALNELQQQPIVQPTGVIDSLIDAAGFGGASSGERKKYVPGKPSQSPPATLDASKQRRLKELYKKRDELLKKQGKK